MDNTTMLVREFLKRHPLDAARILEAQPVDDVAVFLEDVPIIPAARVLEIMDTVIVEQCLKAMNDNACAGIIGELPLEIAALYLRGMQQAKKKSLISLLPEDLGKALEKVLQYPEGTIGAIMDPLVFTVPDDLSIEDLLKRMRNDTLHVIDYVYVINRKNSLVGFVTLRDLMVESPAKTVSAVMLKCDVTIPAMSTIQAVKNLSSWSEFRALPIVDENGIFLGAIEHRTLRRISIRELEKQEVDAISVAGSALGELFWLGMSGLVRGTRYAVRGKEEVK